MKKHLCMLFSVILLFVGCCVSIPAEEGLGTYDTQDYGFKIDFDQLSHKDHCLVPIEYGILSHDPFASVMGVRYFAISKDTVKAVNSTYNDMSEKDQEKVNQIIANTYVSMAYLIVSNAEEEMAALKAAGIDYTEDMKITEFGTVDDYHYYFLTTSVEDFLSDCSKLKSDKSFEKTLQSVEDKLAAGNAGYTKTTLKSKDKTRADIESARTRLLNKLQETELSAPLDESGSSIGQIISFETTDLDGNTVKSEDLFKDNAITMINVWGTWCGYCIDEMEELAAIHTRLQEKGCGIVGVEDERGQMTEELAEKAREIMSEKGTNYPNVIVPDDNPVFSSITGWPTTFFVDGDGKILTYPIIGANINAYEETVEKLLLSGSSSPSSSPDADGSGTEEDADVEA